MLSNNTFEITGLEYEGYNYAWDITIYASANPNPELKTYRFEAYCNIKKPFVGSFIRVTAQGDAREDFSIYDWEFELQELLFATHSKLRYELKHNTLSPNILPFAYWNNPPQYARRHAHENKNEHNNI